MNFVASVTIDALRELGPTVLPTYEEALVAACEDHPPPFGAHWYGEAFRAVAADPQWLAESLVANAAKEGEGSRDLWALAGRTSDLGVAELLRQHALDESRHAMDYLKLLELAFPGAVDDALRLELMELSPGFVSADRPQSPRLGGAESSGLDDIIQLNLNEIRTRIHQLLMRPALRAVAPPRSRGRIELLSAKLLRDETRHVAYTARLIDSHGNRGSAVAVRERMTTRLAELNAITLRETVGVG